MDERFSYWIVFYGLVIDLRNPMSLRVAAKMLRGLEIG